MKSYSSSAVMRAVILLLLVVPRVAGAQEATEEATPKIPEIADEPKTVDPATILPEAVTKTGTVSFEEAPLSDVAAWVQETTGVPVIIDRSALSGSGLLLTEPVTDKLANESVYLLLNRLRLLELAWFVQDDVIHITTDDVARDPAQFQTRPYNVGDLLDAGHTNNRLMDAVRMIAGVNWEEVDGAGGNVESLGDVLFVRQTRAGHRQITGLLKALRQHARRTFVLDPPQHEALRAGLEKAVSVQLRNVPLRDAVKELSDQAGIDVRLDIGDLKDVGVRDREPVSLVLNERPLKTVLELLLRDLELTWTLRDGVVWITSRDGAQAHLLCAIYDVRDLCRNSEESSGLADAIYTQTSSEWEDVDGSGGRVTFPDSGTMIVLHTPTAHDDVLRLLEAYRQALLASKNRRRSDPANEVSTRYYKLQSRVAEALAEALPKILEADSWKTEERADAPGTVYLLPSDSQVITSVKPAAAGGKGQVVGLGGVLVENSVLVVTQTRNNHEQIQRLISRIQHGDQPLGTGLPGMGGGGFGGGYFRVTPAPASRSDRR